MSWSARLVAVVVAVAAFAAAGSAFAETTIHITAKVRIISGGERMQYHGKVRSPVEECQVGRTVRITSSGDEIGSTETDDKGKFSIKGDAVEDGSKVKFKVKPNGTECPAKTVYVKI